MILSINFVSFWRHFLVFYPLIWQENIVMERRKLCDGTDVLIHTFFPGPRGFFVFLCVCVFFFLLLLLLLLLLSLGVWGVVGVHFK